MENLVFQTSLIAAFVAGMVALFAPCCISFLLPAYLGSVFKEKEKVMLMTLVFGLGIFVVLMPAVLGVSLVTQSLFRYHDTIYTIGGVIMLLISGVTLLGIKLPMPNIPGRSMNGKTDALSIFTLGIFSGLTSACCAPVLIGILAMTFLSPNFFGALSVGTMYVLGMVTPLLLISIFLSGKMPRVAFLRRPLASMKIMGKEYHIILSNLVASAMFFITGSLSLILLRRGVLSMEGTEQFTKMIQNAGGWANTMFGNNLPVNVLFLGGVAFLIYIVSKKV